MIWSNFIIARTISRSGVSLKFSHVCNMHFRIIYYKRHTTFNSDLSQFSEHIYIYIFVKTDVTCCIIENPKRIEWRIYLCILLLTHTRISFILYKITIKYLQFLLTLTYIFVIKIVLESVSLMSTAISLNWFCKSSLGIGWN